MRRLTVIFFLLAHAALASESTLREQVGAFFREQKWAEAQVLLEKALAAEPENAEVCFFLGVCFLNRNDAPGALPFLEKAVALAPANGNYVRHVGDACGMIAQKAGLFAQMTWARKCIAAYDRAVELEPKDINARWSVMEYCRQAPGFLGGGMEKAYVQAAAIKNLDPARGRTAYTELYIAEKKFPEAFAVYDEVLKNSPDDFATLYQVGKLADATGRELDRGLAALQKCLTLAPPADAGGYVPVRWRIGNILAKQGDKAAARAAYEAALAIDPKFSPAAEALAKLN